MSLHSAIVSLLYFTRLVLCNQSLSEIIMIEIQGVDEKADLRKLNNLCDRSSARSQVSCGVI